MTAILGTVALTALHCSDGSNILPSATAGSHNGAGGTTAGSDTTGAGGSSMAGSRDAESGTSGSGGFPDAAGSGGAMGTAGTTTGTAGDVAGAGGATGGGGAAGSGGTAVSDAGGVVKPRDASAVETGAETGVFKSGPFKILVISTPLVFKHPSTGACFDMLDKLGKTTDADLAKNGAAPGNRWTVDRVGSDPKVANYFSEVTAANLKNYDLIFSNNPTGAVFSAAPNGAQKKQIFQEYFDNGGGWAGQHSASDFENNNQWSWFQDNVDGAWFVEHDLPGTAGTLAWESAFANHPILKGLKSPWNASEEWYVMNRKVEAVPGFQVLAKVTVPTSKWDKQPRPAIWIRENPKGGRAFYTIRGHEDSAYQEPEFRDLMLRGILWAAHRL